MYGMQQHWADTRSIERVYCLLNFFGRLKAASKIKMEKILTILRRD